MDNAIEGKRGILDLIDTPAVFDAASEIGINKSVVYDFTAKWISIALVCNGFRVLGFGYIGVAPEGGVPDIEG
jgi:malate dehydrogenase (oxaloacetate-decarboxylating)